MATKENPGAFDCYAKLLPDEPYFLLRGKDPIGSFLVSIWTALRAGNLVEASRALLRAHEAWQHSGRTMLPLDSPKSREASDCAKAMYDWYTGLRLEEVEASLQGQAEKVFDATSKSNL